MITREEVEEQFCPSVEQTNSVVAQFNADLNALLLKYSGTYLNGVLDPAYIEASVDYKGDCIFEVYIPAIFDKSEKIVRHSVDIEFGSVFEAKEPQ